jgi:DNA-binding MarR family transcriptional regulator
VLVATRALVGVAARSLHDVSDEVTLAQYRVLVLLDGRGPLSMGDLAVCLDVNPSTVTRACDVLVDKGLVERGSSTGNRRNVRANLTRRGRRLVKQVMDHRRQLIDDALARMPVDHQRRLARSLAEFATAAGEVSDDAWRLGWALDGRENVSDTV